MYDKFIRFIKILFVPVLLFSACSSKNQAEIKENTTELSPLYLIKSGGYEPFYFELGSLGPVLIPSPAEASLNPFIPWTHSRYIAGFLPVLEDEKNREEVLYASVNRGGVLELRARAGENALYYYPGGESWENFQLTAFFYYRQKPAAVFTREQFFSIDEQAVPSSVVWALSKPFFEAPDIPALNKSSGVILGKDGSWYIRKTNAADERSYFRTGDLSQPGQEINAELYLEASSPLEITSSSCPALLAWALSEAERLLGSPCIAAVVSPEFPAKRFFGSGGTISANEDAEFPREVSGYYRLSVSGREELAVVLFPDGRGVYSRGGAGAIKDGHFALPPLPPGSFAYTGVSLLGEGSGSFLVAAWEEQENWNIGAAGFLLLEIDW